LSQLVVERRGMGRLGGYYEQPGALAVDDEQAIGQIAY
jgi:hypothetical protein